MSSVDEVIENYVDKLSKNKIRIESIDVFYVYALWDKDEIVYVGQSTHLGQRIMAHKKNKTFDSYSFFKCETFDDMDSIEATLIVQLQPKYNVQYGNGYESLTKLRSRIRKMSERHKYNPKYYVNKIRKCLSETEIEMIEFKGSTVIKTQDVPKALEYILGWENEG